MIVQLRPEKKPVAQENETLRRLVEMVKETNLVALDKTMAAINGQYSSYTAACIRVQDIAKRMCRAVHEVGITLPEELR